MATPKEIIDMMIRTTPTPFASGPICPHISMKFIPILRKGSLRQGGPRPIYLLQSKVHRDGHDDRHGHAIQQRRRVLPLLDRIERCLVEERDRAEHLRVLHTSIGANR